MGHLVFQYSDRISLERPSTNWEKLDGPQNQDASALEIWILKKIITMFKSSSSNTVSNHGEVTGMSKVRKLCLLTFWEKSASLSGSCSCRYQPQSDGSFRGKHVLAWGFQGHALNIHSLQLKWIDVCFSPYGSKLSPFRQLWDECKFGAHLGSLPISTRRRKGWWRRLGFVSAQRNKKKKNSASGFGIGEAGRSGTVETTSLNVEDSRGLTVNWIPFSGVICSVKPCNTKPSKTEWKAASFRIGDALVGSNCRMTWSDADAEQRIQKTFWKNRIPSH